jgi:hypothetical protein
VGFSDTTQGYDPQHGFLALDAVRPRVVLEWVGQLSTRLAPDGQPHVTFTGTWAFLEGTGDFEGVRGNGTYEGNFTTEHAYVVRWVGLFAR